MKERICQDKKARQHAYAAGAAAFFGVAFFLGVAALAFFVAGVLGVVLVTRPDLVLPRTAGLSTTAAACDND
jgi:hypothetical protein